jgi:hypothetical protein
VCTPPKAHNQQQVIGLAKLRANYKQFEAKRKLSSSYDLFLSDARILPILPRLLGKSFFKKKKSVFSFPLSLSLSFVRCVYPFRFQATCAGQYYEECCWKHRKSSQLDISLLQLWALLVSVIHAHFRLSS